jgi:hypothetical protein
MKQAITGVVGCVLATITGYAAAMESTGQCSEYVGQTVAPQSFDSAIKGYTAIAPKGEFETTAAYEARRNAALGGSTRPLIVSKEPEDRKFFEYDADAQRMGIKSYAFDNTGFDAWSALYSAGYYGKLDADTSGNLDVVISQTQKPGGTYEASNSFGAKAVVQRIAQTTKVIFQGKAPSVFAGLFPQADKEPYEIGYLNLSPSEAQQLKPQLRLAFVVEPKEPYVIEGTRSVGDTTVRNPTDVTEDFAILVADFRCGLLLDGSNKVLGSYPTL